MPIDDKAAMTISSAIASFKLAKGRIKRLIVRLGVRELLEGGGGGDDDGGRGEDRPLVEGWESFPSVGDSIKSGAC